MTRIGAILLAAGAGKRMGADKALLDLSGQPAVVRVIDTCRTAGADPIVIVRTAGQAALPVDATVSIIGIRTRGEMLDSLRAGLLALPAECHGALVFPVDYALVSTASAERVLQAIQAGHEIVLPIFAGRPGHPIGLSRQRFAQVHGPVESLRDIVSADPATVHPVPVDDPWVHRDLDTPEDLAAARAALRSRLP